MIAAARRPGSGPSLLLLTAVSLVGLVGPAACGGGNGAAGAGSTRTQVTAVQTVDGTPAVFHAGALPAPQGALSVMVQTINGAVNVINGGSTALTVVATDDIVTVYVGVMGSDGYYQVDVPAGSSIAAVLLTLAQLLPDQLTIVFEVADAAGDVSPPATAPTTITTVGTGDVQVSVSWDVDNDLDLHVVDPNGFEIYYAERASPEGGELDLDSNAGCIVVDGIDNENIRWPTGKAPRGTYVVRVDNFAACTAAAVSYVVTVQKAGQDPQTFTGGFPITDVGDEGGAGDGVAVAQFTFP